ncbi:MAG: alpha/beta fold hydrolase, partial [Burkholderiales bacterium]|nr:alpha/beta fold hydrolase [Burkholderiales bacterium]
MSSPGLYPATPPRCEWQLAVDGGHRLHVREYGRADGIPAVVLHGGPGSGCSPLQPRFFDPARYRVICPDQRGAGLSQPRGSIEHNTTAHLLADLRRLREHLGLDGWLVVGGSWGATLAVAHAAAEPAALRAHARARGWDELRLLSAGSSTFKHDLLSEDDNGSQDSTVSVFTRDVDGTIRHRYT